MQVFYSPLGDQTLRSQIEDAEARFSTSTISPVEIQRVDSAGMLRPGLLTSREMETFNLNVMSINAALRCAGSGDAKARIDQKARLDGKFQHFLHADPRVKVAKAQGIIREDSIAGGDLAGVFLPYELATISGKVLEQPMAKLNGRAMFPVNSEASNGAREYIVRRSVVRGTASFGGTVAQTPTPNASVSRGEIKTKVQYATAGFGVSVFDLSSASFANFMLQDNGIKGAIRALHELENNVIWYGDVAAGLFGVLDHPYMPTVVPSLTFSASADSQEMAQTLAGVVNSIIQQSFQAFKPDTIVMSSKLYGFLKGQNITIGTTALPVTIIDWLERNCMVPLTGGIHFAQELDDKGPGGSQPFFVYGKNEDAVRIISTGGVQALPVQFIGTQVNQIYYMGIGGLNSYNPANNGLAYITLS